ncbi:hypothetical protein MMC28_006558 [Mycoblastus sanguinarius]|nr:hypothetical protein [Mycoblastus sanguinarius]
MSTNAPVILILGAGANIGAHVARAFAAKGYQVALTSRTKKPSEDGLHFQSDLSDPSSMTSLFQQVTKALGPPSVVVYNASAMTPNDKDDPLSLSVSDLTRELAVNTTSVLAAAHETTLAFAELPASASKTFIYTGNKLNTGPILPLLSLGIGKSATAHMISSASQAYKEKGYKFYYADERTSDGAPMYKDLSGSAHADFYIGLAESKTQGPWQATFVKGSGYTEF